MLARLELQEDELMAKLLSAVTGTALATVIVSLPTGAAAQFATPVSPGYIPETVVAAALERGGVLLQEPGLTIAAERVSASSTAALDATTHHIVQVKAGSATLVTGGRLSNGVIVGGQDRHLTEGDLITIPANTPYWWKEVPSGTITYLAVHKETPRSGDTWGLPNAVQLIGRERIRTRMTEPGGPRDPLLRNPGVVFYGQRVGPDDAAEAHPNHSHIFLLMDGEASFMTSLPGTAIVDGSPAGPANIHRIRKGGIMIVPATTPHQWVETGNNEFGPPDSFGYIAINMDTPR
jgi:quercetin dioxygenase-like cupin family protein